MLLRILVCALSLAVACGAAAQTYRWVDKDGKVRYGDTPPPGVNARQLSGPSAPATAPDAAAKDANKGPLTPAEQEQDFRKRQLEAQKAEQKAAATAKDQEIKAENCRRARESLATLESGRRILRTDAQGEQYYLEDDARAAEIQRAQKAVQDWCN
jgi:hypothetical protein